MRSGQSDIPWYSNIYQWQREALKLTVFHTDPHSSILVVSLHEWFTEPTRMGTAVPLHESPIACRCLHMIDVETHRECCFGTSMFTVSHGSIVQQNPSIIPSRGFKCVKGIVWLCLAPNHITLSDLFAHPISQWIHDQQTARLNLAAVAAQVHAPIVQLWWLRRFWGPATCILCAVARRSRLDFLVGGPIWPRKPGFLASFPWLVML